MVVDGSHRSRRASGLMPLLMLLLYELGSKSRGDSFTESRPAKMLVVLLPLPPRESCSENRSSAVDTPCECRHADSDGMGAEAGGGTYTASAGRCF